MKSGSVIAFAAVNFVLAPVLSLYNFKRFTHLAVLALARSAPAISPSAVAPNACASAKTVSAIILLIVRIISASALIVIDFSTAA